MPAEYEGLGDGRSAERSLTGYLARELPGCGVCGAFKELLVGGSAARRVPPWPNRCVKLAIDESENARPVEVVVVGGHTRVRQIDREALINGS